MNERIQKITEQVLDELVPETWVALGYDKIKEIQRRTAELIVRECMKLNHDILCEDDPDYLDQVYKEHFGVEE
jgi:hypothetical protein